MINNGLTKGVLFLSVGNIHRAYASKSTDDVRGALRRTPLSAGLLLAGFFAITGSPPFGPFLSEFTIVNAAMVGGQYTVAALFLGMLIIVFVGMGSTVLSVVQGEPGPLPQAPTSPERLATVAPGFLLLALVLLLGIHIPNSLDELLRTAAATLGAR
jgi:hydrogenase-4 component F